MAAEIPEDAGTARPEKQPKSDLVGTISGWVRSLLGSATATGATENGAAKPATVMLPETVLYASKYRGARFGRDEVEAMLQPQFAGAGIYLALKFLDELPAEQERVVKEILNMVAAGADYSKIDLMLLDRLRQLQEPNAAGSTIDGKKVAQVYRQGFELFEQKFGELARELCAGEDVPVLVAYAGLLGLKPFLEAMAPDKKLAILNPEKVGAVDVFGYMVTRTAKGFDLKTLKQGDDFSGAVDGKRVVLVDDTKRTGETLEKVQFIFRVQDNWPKVAGERFVVSPGNADKWQI